MSYREENRKEKMSTTEENSGFAGKPILCLDFDGVCHMYTSGWKGAAIIPDSAVPGLEDFLRDALEVFDVAIFSSRSHQDGGMDAMKVFFDKHVGEKLRKRLSFPMEKPPAFVALDDRVVTFRGEWPDVQELRTFKTWTQNPLGATNRFPRGKTTASDEGELKLAIYAKDGTIFIDFGKTTAWLGLDSDSARQMAELLIKHADALAG
jgi:hypothetical protein